MGHSRLGVITESVIIYRSLYVNGEREGQRPRASDVAVMINKMCVGDGEQTLGCT